MHFIVVVAVTGPRVPAGWGSFRPSGPPVQPGTVQYSVISILLQAAASRQ